MNARDLVTTRIAQQARLFPDLDIAHLDTADLEPRDAALARAIDHAVLRRWLTLTAVIDARLTQAWEGLEPNVQAPLLVGAAQLYLMERLPDHAVINHAVQWTKQHARPKAGGLVNAVLRRLAELRETTVETHDPTRTNELPREDGTAWRLTDSIFDDDPVVRLAQLTSHPIPLIRHWIDGFGMDAASNLARHSLVHAPLIVTGLTVDDPNLTPHEQPGSFVFAGAHDELVSLLKNHPGARVQDPTAGEPVESTRQMSPSVIMDYCAGVGTKTAQLLACHPEARVIATDRNKQRLETLRQTLGGQDRVEVVDFARIREYDGQVELLLLDVSCSNSGVLARRVEARYRLNASSLEKLVAVQRQIVADSLPLLAENGRLLYATCSIEPDENQHQSQWITHWHPLRVVQAAIRSPQGLPGEPPGAYRDGGYFAQLEPA